MGKQAGRGALEEVGRVRRSNRRDSAGVSPPEKAGSMEAAALSTAVKGESTCMGHTQAAGRGQAGDGTVPQDRSRRKAGTGSMFLTKGAFTSKKGQHSLALNPALDTT